MVNTLSAVYRRGFIHPAFSIEKIYRTGSAAGQVRKYYAATRLIAFCT
jgi:hypothetical protein